MAGRVHRRSARMALHRYHPFCHWCRRPLRLRKATLDHFLPRALGGKDRFENIVIACASCNNARGCRRPSIWDLLRFSTMDRRPALAEYRRLMGRRRMAELDRNRPNPQVPRASMSAWWLAKAGGLSGWEDLLTCGANVCTAP